MYYSGSSDATIHIEDVGDVSKHLEDGFLISSPVDTLTGGSEYDT